MTDGQLELPDLLNPAGFDTEAAAELGRQDIAKRKVREKLDARRRAGRDVPDGEIFNPLMYLGVCPVCQLALNATYSTVRRDGVAYHADCDPKRPDALCARCETPVPERTGLIGLELYACDDCYAVAYAMICGTWLRERVKGEWPISPTTGGVRRRGTGTAAGRSRR